MCIKLYFKNSIEAIEYGTKHKNDVEAKKNLAVALIDNTRLRDNEKNINKKAHLACNCQFIREALETMYGETIEG